MNSVIFQETAKLKKPVPAEKVIELSEKLLEPSSHSKRYPPRLHKTCLLYTSPSPRDGLLSRMPSSA